MSLLNLPDDNLGLLSLGLRMMSTPGNFGQALGQAGMGALGDVQQHSANRQRREMTALQTQQVRAQMEEAERQRRSQEALRGYMGGLDPDAGMTPDMPGPRRDPQEFNAFQAVAKGADFGPAFQMQQALQKAQPEEYTLTPGAARFRGGQQIAAVPVAPKEVEPTTLAKLIAERDKFPPGSPMRAIFDQRIAKESTHQPAASVSVNTGQRGLDNTLKLRGDFRSEPIYKAHQEMQSAYSQIQQSLKQASPAGDLAGATKIMKLLDPGSVVRESELGMAMAASGLMDRIQNYASMIVNGTKLTPTQRKDFQTLADALFRESTNQYNAKRSEYEGIATRNGLSTADVLGPPGEMPKPTVIDFGALK